MPLSESVFDTPLPPIVQPDLSCRSTSRLSLVSPGHHTTPTYSQWTPSVPVTFTGYPRASASRSLTDPKASLRPLKHIPPMPTLNGEQCMPQATSINASKVDLKLSPTRAVTKKGPPAATIAVTAPRPILNDVPGR